MIAKRSLRTGLRVAIGLGVSAVVAGLAVAATAPASIAWVYPVAKAKPPAPPTELRRLPNTDKVFTVAQMTDRWEQIADWRPETHPPMPPAVASGRRPARAACGYCHLPNGVGRPENYPLAGLPAEYLRRQTEEIASGARKVVDTSYAPATAMHAAAVAATPAEIAETAEYFSRIPYVSHTKVIEAATIPRAVAEDFLYRFATDGSKEPIGERIVEGPTDFDRFFFRDPLASFVAYVPPGSIRRGKALAAGEGACASCHGANLRGGEGAIAPPIAGRYPSGLFRQLHAFQTGDRAGRDAAMMTPVVAKLSNAQMIDLAAYVGSLKP